MDELEAATVAAIAGPGDRTRALGKFLWAGGRKLYVKGATYGAFRPDADGAEYHDHGLIEHDFALMAQCGFNAVRIPHTLPPVSLLDAAERHGLKVMVGLSAEQYAGYLADPEGAPDVARVTAAKVRGVAGHPALLCYALGNEIQAPLARWLGASTIESYLERLHEAVKSEDPDALVTYVNYPTTEYLDLPFLDLVAFNVYLEQPDRLDAYLARLQVLAGDRPLLMSELGLDALRNGEEAQADALRWQIRHTFSAGSAGAFVFSWTDEWFRAGEQVDDWAFGLTRIDRSPKPALAAVSAAFAEVPFAVARPRPGVSVVVCTHNGARTLPRTLAGLAALDYPDYEVIVVDDGSRDDSAAIAEGAGARVIRTQNRGLSSARNTGAAAATKELVAYLDDDAWPDPHWLHYLADAFEHGYAAVGGPNVPPPEGVVAESVARSPGGPIHVLVSDTEAEHIPGCNFAIRRDVLDELGGFDPQFRAAGDDVDLCWRLQEAGHRIGFAHAAMVWHLRRDSVRGYLRQQRGYGRAEALLERKWPHRYNAAGHVSWGGRVYGSSVGRWLGVRRSRIYGGVWGSAPFQSVYQPAPSLLDALARMPEWNLVILLLAAVSALGLVWTPLALALPLLVLAVLLPLGDAVYATFSTRFGRRPRRQLALLRATTFFLHLAQPVARLVGRVEEGLTPWRLRAPAGFALPRPHETAVWTEAWREPQERLAELHDDLRAGGLAVRSGGEYDAWDVEVRGGALGAARLLFAAEDHGAGTQYLRFRVTPRASPGGLVGTVTVLALALLASLAGDAFAAVALGACAALLYGLAVWEGGVAVAAIRQAVEAQRVEPLPELDAELEQLAARTAGTEAR